MTTGESALARWNKNKKNEEEVEQGCNTRFKDEEDEAKSTKKANDSQSSSQSSRTKAKNSEKKYFAVESTATPRPTTPTRPQTMQC
ncbi:hypothetical protein E4U52_002682 [Claviceps spartinae]|nr:hypothetical protein E4U52_002682 [Claviceps spartinae]